MSTQEPSIYREFQEYGVGKAKLYARIFGELEETAGVPSTDEAIREFERLSHNSALLDHRVVDTRDSFAGEKSIRAMAEECGLLDLYRTAYYVSSGVAHSEWWSVEVHCLERCRNVLHRGHLIPTLSLNAGNNEAIAKSWIDYQYSLIRSSLDILAVDQSAIESAFAWLNENTDAEKDT